MCILARIEKYARMYTYKCTCMCIHTRVHICTHTHVHVYTCTHMRVPTDMFATHYNILQYTCNSLQHTVAQYSRTRGANAVSGKIMQHNFNTLWQSTHIMKVPTA